MSKAQKEKAAANPKQAKTAANPTQPKVAANLKEAKTDGKSRNTVHPNYRRIKVINPDGSVYETKSTYHDDTLRLEIDPSTHPAWRKNNEPATLFSAKNSTIKRFNDSYGSIDFSDILNSSQS